ncbi:MAG: S-layer homology domain-containing protein [Clostridia bacterium]|nr:S-layer homology domain-containing protein [Clostridia bacterium]
MKWKKQTMSIVLTGCLAAGALAPAATAVDVQDITEQIVTEIGEKQVAAVPEYLQTKATYFSKDNAVDKAIAGHTYSYLFDNNDNIKQMTEQYFEIDDNGKEVVDPDERSTTYYTYDSRGNLIKSDNGMESCTYTYDADGKMTKEIYVYEVEEGYNSYVIDYIYDSDDVLEKCEVTYDSSSIKVITTLEYDEDGRVKTATSVLEGDSTVDETENVVMIIEYAYDENDNVISTKAIFDGKPDGTTIETTYTYDTQGNLVKTVCGDDSTVYDYQLTSEWKAEHPTTVDQLFDDIKLGSWYYQYVQAAYDMGLMNGTSDTAFSPNGGLSRAMLVQILYNAEGKPQVTGKSSFSDVKAGTWYYNAVVWAEQNNVSAGVGGGKFGTNEVVSRDQLATMLHNYAGKPEADAAVLAKYPDANKVSGWAVNGMSWAVSNEIITGSKQADGSIHLDPKSNATRAQAATILSKYFSEKK